MKNFRGTKGLLIVVILIVAIVGYYYYLSNRAKPKEEDVKISVADEILLQNLEKNYPPSPKEVVKFYLEVTKCMYNEQLTEEEIEKLGKKIQEIYDRELIANKTEEMVLKDLKCEILAFQEGDCSIVNYSTSSSTDVDYFTEDGYSFARLYGTFYMRVGKKMSHLEQVFLLRKDQENHWKIYGWQPVVEEQTGEKDE